MLTSRRRHSAASVSGVVPHDTPVGKAKIALVGGQLRLVAVGGDLVGIDADQQLVAAEARLDPHGQQHERQRGLERCEVVVGAAIEARR